MLNATNYVNYKFENITFISRFHGLDIIELTPSRSLLANKPSPLKNEKKKNQNSSSRQDVFFILCRFKVYETQFHERGQCNLPITRVSRGTRKDKRIYLT